MLAAYPQRLAEINGELNPDGVPNTPFVVRDCQGTVCSYYQYLQGTSMVSPHAALVVGRLGKPDRFPPRQAAGRRSHPEGALPDEHRPACPQPRLYHYTRIRPAPLLVAESEAYCAGPPEKNGFYGRGIVNAYLAAGGSRS